MHLCWSVVFHYSFVLLKKWRTHYRWVGLNSLNIIHVYYNSAIGIINEVYSMGLRNAHKFYDIIFCFKCEHFSSLQIHIPTATNFFYTWRNLIVSWYMLLNKLFLWNCNLSYDSIIFWQLIIFGILSSNIVYTYTLATSNKHEG